jgi:hypothetical protein
VFHPLRAVVVVNVIAIRRRAGVSPTFPTRGGNWRFHSKKRQFPPHSDLQLDPIIPLADAAGRFADACEKIDHLEEFLPIARTAIEDILEWTLSIAAERNLNLHESIRNRRKELADRQFYIAD